MKKKISEIINHVNGCLKLFEQERPGMDDRKNLVCKGKILRKNFNVVRKYWGKCFLTDTLAKTSQNIFAYSFVSEHSKHSFLFQEKKLEFFIQ